MDPDRVLHLNQELSRIRSEQQEHFKEISNRVQKEKKEKMLQRRKEMRDKLEQKEVGTGHRLGRRPNEGGKHQGEEKGTRDSISRSNYNPLMPSSGMSSNYRPARRCPPGGGRM